MDARQRTPDLVLAASIAAVIFLLSFLVLNLGLLPSLGATAIGIVAGVLFLRTKSTAVKAKESNQRNLLQNGHAQRDAIQSLARRITKPSMTLQVQRIIGSVDKTLETLEADPAKVQDAVQFLDYYLNSTVKVLSVYTELSQKSVHDSEIQQAIAKTESTLATIADGFDAQLAKLLSKDVLDLTTELKVLQENMIGDGLIDAWKPGKDSSPSDKN